MELAVHQEAYKAQRSEDSIRGKTKGFKAKAQVKYSNVIRGAKRNICRKFREIIRLYKILTSLKCCTFAEKRKDRFPPLLKIYFPGCYSILESSTIPPNAAKADKGKKNTENCKILKTVCSEARVRWSIGIFI